MTEEYTETGGLRCGLSFWDALNYTWPFARLRITKDVLEITLRGLISTDEKITFQKADVKAIRRKRGLWSVGMLIEHTVPQRAAPYFLFWTFSFRRLQEQLIHFGYPVETT